VAFRDLGKFLSANRKLWLPPIILTAVIFLALVLFGPGNQAITFVYKIF
jgi:hypothetical protein